MSFWSRAALRVILTSETDTDSNVNKELMSQIRENWEALVLILLGTSVYGTLTADPPNDTTGVATDTGNFSTDEHNGRTLFITSGLAKGNLYTIDDTTANTVICTGDNLYADGVRSGDTYRVLYDLKTNADGHDHDGINSKAIILPSGSIMLPAIMSKYATGYNWTPSSDHTWEDAPGNGDTNYRVYIPPGYTTVYAAVRMHYEMTGPNYGAIRFKVGSSTSTGVQSTSTSYSWQTDSMSLSGLSGWQDLTWQFYSEDTSPIRGSYLQGFSFYIG